MIRKCKSIIDLPESLLQQGIRFGIAVALLATIPTYMIYYAFQPMLHELVHLQIIYDSIAMVIVGIVAAFVNK